MAVNLYKHNGATCIPPLKTLMLNTKGKTAVIHPTGTGISFIGFNLCENFSDRFVCRFLSCPSLTEESKAKLDRTGMFRLRDYRRWQL